MKEPIKPEDIRKGDLIRREPTGRRSLRAVEYVAERDGHAHGMADSGSDSFFLLDRPAPAVDLPKCDTLGWLSGSGNDSVLAIWKPEQLTGGPGMSPARHGFRALLPEVTSFVEAVAVPKAALEKLTDAWQSWAVSSAYESLPSDVATFIAEVHDANGGDAR